MIDENGRPAGSTIRDPVLVAGETVDRGMQELYEFGPFRLEPAERKLLRGSEVVALTPKAFDTLVVLVRNGGHLLEKEELIRTLWPDSFVEEGNLSNNIFLLRKALGEAPSYIETVPKRGYRFVGAVRQLPSAVPLRPEKPVEGQKESAREVPTERRQSLAVIAAIVAAALLASGMAWWSIKGNVKNIFLPPPDAQVYFATSSPSHQRRRSSGVVPWVVPSQQRHLS